jgi:hypothetical protein
MSVPPTDDDTLRKSSHIDRDLWHPFNLDNISYITKDRTRNPGAKPTTSESQALL